MDTAIVYSGDLSASTISGQVARGVLRRIATGVYLRNSPDSEETVVRRHLNEIVGRLFPGAVITDRSAPTSRPVDGVLYLARDASPRDLQLPGVLIRARKGAGPQFDDIPLPGGLHLASNARGLAENCLESRQRKSQRRTLTEGELGDWVDRLCRTDGEDRLRIYRERAEELAETLLVPRERLDIMRQQIGLALGTKEVPTASAALASRRDGSPIDQGRMERFVQLIDALRVAQPQSRPAALESALAFEPFAESYFSNYIEGTEFDFDEAATIVFEDEIPEARPEDAHDIIDTQRLLADKIEMSYIPATGADFLETLKRRHRRIMQGRPNVLPGVFKMKGNRAGNTLFVDPLLAPGTLAAGYALKNDLDSPWERAIYVCFLVTEVHPFNDGNGRVARAMMSAELDAGGQSRIIIPTVFRDDYIDGLRLLSRQDNPGVYIKTMRYAHDFTASVDFSDYRAMKSDLEAANAFEEPNSPNRLRVLGRRLSAASREAAPWRTPASAQQRVPKGDPIGGEWTQRSRPEGDGVSL